MNYIIENKTAAIFDLLQLILISEISGGFHITWSTSESYQNQMIQIAYRLGDNSDDFVLMDQVARDDGEADTPNNLLVNENYTMWFRVENDFNYGIWQCFKNLITTI